MIHKITFIYENTGADREDLFQEICLQLWKSYRTFREESLFSTWMYRVALNTAINSLRKKKNKVVYEPLKDFHQLKAEVPENKENTQRLYQAVSQLNRIDKAIILLWLENKSYDEIASIMGTSKTNVSVKLVRIKRKLKERILIQ